MPDDTADKILTASH